MGNETAYAIILGSWLFWIAVGSFYTSFLSNKMLQTWSDMLYNVREDIGEGHCL